MRVDIEEIKLYFYNQEDAKKAAKELIDTHHTIALSGNWVIVHNTDNLEDIANKYSITSFNVKFEMSCVTNDYLISQLLKLPSGCITIDLDENNIHYLSNDSRVLSKIAKIVRGDGGGIY